MKKLDAISELEELIERAEQKYDYALAHNQEQNITYYSARIAALRDSLEIVRFIK